MSPFLALALLQAKSPATDPNQLMTGMIARYAKAKTLVGRVEAEVQAAGEKVRVSTEIAYARPSRLVIRQREVYKDSHEYLVVSDGEKLVYTNPFESMRKAEPYLEESVIRTLPVATKDGAEGLVKSMNVGDMYAAGSQSLADRCVPLDIAVGRNADLQYLLGQIIDIADGGEVMLGGAKARKLTGKWRPYADARDSWGTYEIYISPELDLLCYKIIQHPYAVGKKRNELVPMTSTWTSRFEVNVPVEQSRFDLPDKRVRPAQGKGS